MNEPLRIESNEWLSRAVRHGELVFLSGMTADDVEQDVVGQTKQVLQKIDSYLRRAGSNRSGLLSAQIYLQEIRDWEAVTLVWREWIDSSNPPARAVVGADLRLGQLVEVMVVAARVSHE